MDVLLVADCARIEPRDVAFDTKSRQPVALELGLQPWYRDCVRPLLRMPAQQWPRCCGRGCEPCANILNAVANRVQTLLETGER